MVSEFLESLFPRLRGSSYRITSPVNKDYNCVAWAVGDERRWWWPGTSGREFWPPGGRREETIEAFLEAFGSRGFTICALADVESGFEKIAFFADADGLPTHACRQLASGRWTSKLGELEDIEHELLDLAGDEYGAVAIIMRRQT